MSWIANQHQDKVMNVVVAVVALLALGWVIGRLVRLVARDGLGSNPPPRSHVEELGPWAFRELRR
jgi:hypothetical protein